MHAYHQARVTILKVHVYHIRFNHEHISIEQELFRLPFRPGTCLPAKNDSFDAMQLFSIRCVEVISSRRKRVDFVPQHPTPRATTHEATAGARSSAIRAGRSVGPACVVLVRDDTNFEGVLFWYRVPETANIVVSPRLSPIRNQTGKTVWNST